MTRKSLGYVELEWTCKRCGTKNPGLAKTCTNCGAPMDEGDQFELPEEQKLSEDEAVIEAGEKGADVHCPYCGARNPADAKTCVQCGGDLAGGDVREAGRVMGAHDRGLPAAQIACPYCDEKISPNAPRCPHCGGDLTQRPKAAPAQPQPKSKPKRPVWMVALGAILVVLCCGALAVFAFLSFRTEDINAQVQSVSWQRTVAILEERLVDQEGWEADLPFDAQNMACRDRYRETSNFPAPNATEVCGTPYTVDQGSGVGEVVQDCEYEVYESYCDYQVLQWTVVTQSAAQDDNLQPYWPELNLGPGQREGDREERYTVIFASGGKRYTYETSDPDVFSQFTPGSDWTLEVNTFGGVTRVSP